MFLIFDTETTGLPRNWNAPSSATGNWPRMVQIAWVTFDANGIELERQNYIIQPEGYAIPKRSASIHGITTERAIKEGVPLAMVLESFQTLVEKCKYIVAHNVDFDEKVLGAEYYRVTGKDPMVGIPTICTMKDRRVVKYCALLPKNYGRFKWPKLGELHAKLFGTGFEDAHDAAVDVGVTARCFWELKRREIL